MGSEGYGEFEKFKKELYGIDIIDCQTLENISPVIQREEVSIFDNYP